MLQVYGDEVSVEDLRGIEVRRPDNAGRCWRDLKHFELVDSLNESFDAAGFTGRSQKWAVSKGGAELFGGFTFEDSEVGPNLHGACYSVGFRSSNNMRYAVTMAMGAEVMVCKNGVITGTHVLSRKHTSGLRVNDLARRAVYTFINRISDVSKWVDGMRSKTLTTVLKDHLLMQAVRNGIMSGSHIAMVDAEYLRPRHQEFETRTAWSLYNAFTTIAQEQVSGHPRFSPARQFEAMNKFGELLLAA